MCGNPSVGKIKLYYGYEKAHTDGFKDNYSRTIRFK